ncbi:unnamed protein product [Cunninghamella blakesleeana]
MIKRKKNIRNINNYQTEEVPSYTFLNSMMAFPYVFPLPLHPTNNDDHISKIEIKLEDLKAYDENLLQHIE